MLPLSLLHLHHTIGVSRSSLTLTNLPYHVTLNIHSIQRPTFYHSNSKQFPPSITPLYKYKPTPFSFPKSKKKKMANKWNFPMKAVAVSTGVFSVAVILKLSLPVILDFLTFELPLLWSFALSWLQPPYLYLLINCIIISIVASSKLQPRAAAASGEEVELAKFPGDEVAVMKEEVVVVEREAAAVAEEVVFGCVDDDDEKKAELAAAEERESGGGGGGGGEFVVSKSKWTPPKTPVSSAEKPPYSARFGHRKTVKSSPEGRLSLSSCLAGILKLIY